ncbi:MAG: hypothetical protein CMJ83_12365 [Planctomycetes bacterium]|nr:hypothetical protein [Planctomycetota bacterium]
MSDVARFQVATARARVFILYTGGTIGMEEEMRGGVRTLTPQPMGRLVQHLERVSSETGIEIEARALTGLFDSSSMGPPQWQQIADVIEEVYESCDGIVVLHGTDTLAYTASALSFMLENLGKPIVLTGSQLPISHVRTDATQNLVNAVCVAGWRATSLPCIPEVVVVFADSILRGCRTRKVSASSLRGFVSPNYPALGTIGERIEVHLEHLRAAPESRVPFCVVRGLSTEVLDLSLFPGFSADHLARILVEPSEIKAVLLRTYGAGNAPEDPEFLDVITDVAKKAKVIVNVTQCLEGMIQMGLYGASTGLLERGVVSGLDMTPEAALTKLMWALQNRSGADLISFMQTDQRGEQSENLFDLAYGACPDGTSHYSATRRPDARLTVPRIGAAILRVVGLEAEGEGRVRVMLNHAAPMRAGENDDPRVLVDLRTDELRPEVTVRVRAVRVRRLIGDGDARLDVVGSSGVKVRFQGLHLTLYARVHHQVLPGTPGPSSS